LSSFSEHNGSVLFTWSGGKDSALALFELRRNPDCTISSLLTTITEDYDRISMHGVRSILLARQAESLGLAIDTISIPSNSSNEEYEAKLREKLQGYHEQGVRTVAFGDIFLEDLKKYREEKLSAIGMQALFPLWKRDTLELSHTFLDLGFKAVITCVDSQVLDRKFAGRLFDEHFLAELPSNVDPCGENGEFHSFVFDGPIFRKRIDYTVGEVVLRDNRFYFCDLLPQGRHG
jgi:uncharacterized protein (TIGR00290 family)